LDWKPKHQLSFVKNYSDTKSAERIDAEYFQPMYDEIISKLANEFFVRPIGKYDFIDVTTGQYAENYVEKTEGFPYIRGTDLSRGSVNMDSLVYITEKDQEKSKLAKEGDVVVTRVGTIGLSARIPKECIGGTISDNLIRLRFDNNKLDSYYMGLYLDSILGKSLMIRNSRGSVQQRLNQETLKEIVVPILDMSSQKRIARKVEESHEAYNKSKSLLEIAKRGVEIAIEENETEAEKWINNEIEKLGVSPINED
jgi:type I restriction enzyme, S subunit